MLRALALFLALANPALAEPISLKRGLNLGLWNNWLSIGEMLGRPETLNPYPDWQSNVTPRMLEVLVEQGFDFVRMPTDPGPMLAYGPGARQDKLIAGIHQASRTALEAGLNVIVDLHPLARGDETGGSEDIVGDLWPEFVAMVTRLAADLATLPSDRVALEFLNEPAFDCEAVYAGAPPRWPDMQAELLAAVRKVAPDLTVVLTGACYGGSLGLATLDPGLIQDDKVLWSFHSYDPSLFSHQGATWSSDPERYFWDLPYPPSSVTDDQAGKIAAAAADRMAAAEGQADTSVIDKLLADYRSTGDGAVTAEIDRAVAWADQHGLARDRLLLGEYGALHSIDGRTLPRAWYLAFVTDKRKAAEAAGMGWAVLGYVGGMGIADADSPDRRLDRDTCRALGLPCAN